MSLADTAKQMVRDASDVLNKFVGEAESEAHEIFRSHPGHQAPNGKGGSSTAHHVAPGVQHPGSTGQWTSRVPS